MRRPFTFRLREFVSGSAGAISVEFVVVLPLILAALAFAFEFGRVAWAQHILTENVRAATRFLARTELTDATRTRATNIVTSGSPDATGGTFWGEQVTVTVYPSATNAPIRTFTAPTYRLDGEVIRIEATVPVTMTMLGFLGVSTAMTVGAAAEARHIGD